jgi:hypothetical protein
VVICVENQFQVEPEDKGNTETLELIKNMFEDMAQAISKFEKPESIIILGETA